VAVGSRGGSPTPNELEAGGLTWTFEAGLWSSMATRYARLRPSGRSPLSLDSRLTYRVVAKDEVPGYVWIEGAGIGDRFLNPNRRCLPVASLEVSETPE
jgi:hypothetical protein